MNKVDFILIMFLYFVSDIDECQLGKCDLSTTTCANMDGSFLCSCLSGMHKTVKGATSCVGM